MNHLEQLNQLISDLPLTKDQFNQLHTLIAEVRIEDAERGADKYHSSYFWSKARKLRKKLESTLKK